MLIFFYSSDKLKRGILYGYKRYDGHEVHGLAVYGHLPEKGPVIPPEFFAERLLAPDGFQRNPGGNRREFFK